MNDDEWMICHRVTEIVTPSVLSRHGACALCGLPVWVADSSPQNIKLICAPCYVAIYSESYELHGPSALRGPTARQLADIKASLKRQNQ